MATDPSTAPLDARPRPERRIPCCEGARRLEAIPGDAATLRGYWCPEHGDALLEVAATKQCLNGKRECRLCISCYTQGLFVEECSRQIDTLKGEVARLKREIALLTPVLPAGGQCGRTR